MNTLKTLFVCILITLFIACKKEAKTALVPQKNSADAQKKPIDTANLQTTKFTINGMTCAMGCAKTIEERLTEQNGVQSATVDFEKKLGTVTFDKTIQNSEKITTIVEAVGDGKTYTVER